MARYKDDPVTPIQDLLRELSNRDPDEVVDLLQLNTQDILQAFPEQVHTYLDSIRESEMEVVRGWNEDGEELERIDLDDYFEAPETRFYISEDSDDGQDDR